VLAIADHNFRPTFGDLAKVGVGGYLGQLLPEANKRSGDSLERWRTRPPEAIAAALQNATNSALFVSSYFLSSRNSPSICQN
jgi:hypothetical protein